MDFNLLVSCGRNLERYARNEMLRFLKKMGDETPAAIEFGFSGLIGIRTSLNPFEVINELNRITDENPWEFRFILKVKPIEVVVETDINKIKDAVKELLHKIAPNESFRVTVKKRGSDISGKEIIKEVADLLDNPVNLEKPDKIILIEVIGDLTGISIVTEKDIVSIASKKLL
ncbi:MAG: THUMP domain-containing protein [Candidatus Asgardarchaeia archaeon]